MHSWRRQPLWLVGLSLLLIAIFLGSLSIGPIALGPSAWGRGLSVLEHQVLFQLRLPRALLAVMLGAGLAISGYVLQILLHNPLAEPGIIGVSSGASLLAVTALFVARLFSWHLEPWLLSGAACAGALLVTLCLLALSRRGRLDNSGMLLLGVAIGMGSGAITAGCSTFLPMMPCARSCSG